MIIYLTRFLLITLVYLKPSYEYPIGKLQPDQVSQGVARIFTEVKKPAYSFPEESDGENVNLVKGEDEDEAEGAQDLQELSPNTADTMRKINPLTIADQVSQMFRKGSQKVNLANKSGSGFRLPDRDMRGQASQGDQSLAMPTGPEAEDSPIRSGYVRQEVPKIVNKPRSNDYGYSVIVLAGDAVHLPIKVQGKSVRGQGRGTLADKDSKDVYRAGEAEEKISLEERKPKKEVRVYKQFSKNPDFPVYDDDLNFVPDPFHGLLDENYQIEVGNYQQPTSHSENLRNINDRRGLHRVHVRSEKDAGSGNMVNEKMECGSWGKGNATESEVIAPLGNEDSDDN